MLIPILEFTFNKSLLFWTDSSDIDPTMTAERAKKLAEKGSNVSLTCFGHNVFEGDSRVLWTFNGHEIQENDTNKKAINKFQRRKWEGRFSLLITNIQEKDVGNFSCVVRVRNGNRILTAEDVIELSLHKKGESVYFYSNPL